MSKYYFTTTLPYVNGDPHIGFAMEITRADSIVRFLREQGHEVFFNTGTDEHGTKIFQKAKELGKDTQEFVDEKSEHFKDLTQKLNISEHKFIRTTDLDHEKAAQEFWKKCDKAGFIEKKKYSGLYCSGCEMFLKEGDLVDGECPNHPNRKPEFIEEENYFFKYSAFAAQLLDLYKEKPNFVIPDFRLNEIKKFVEGGLEDFSISRVAEKMPWGIPVPGDDSQVMYVWFDALVNYISTLGWGSDNSKNFEKFWEDSQVTKIQICGKDNIQHQAARWQAMLMSVGIATTDRIIINGFITSGGQKMSKSIGNVIDPRAVIEEYNQYGSGADALRYYLLRELHPYEDSDFTMERFKEVYDANLANGLGNVVSRVMKMAEKYEVKLSDSELKEDFNEVLKGEESYKTFFSLNKTLNLKLAIDLVWKEFDSINKEMQEKEPFKLIKENPDKAKEIILDMVRKIWKASFLLKPFLPETSEKIQKAIKENKKPEALFMRAK